MHVNGSGYALESVTICANREIEMSIQAILLPLFVEVALTFYLGVWMAYLRTRDLRSRAVHPSKIALREPNWPLKTQLVGYCFSNQFELPILFYVLTILEVITRHADLIFLILAWVFVLTRIMHAIVHTTTNRIQFRGAWYGFGAAALLIAWIIYAVRILAGLP
jgi:hypothetical protein